MIGIAKVFGLSMLCYFIVETTTFSSTFVSATNQAGDNRAVINDDPATVKLPIVENLFRYVDLVSDNENNDIARNDPSFETTSISSLRYETSREKLFRPGRRRIDFIGNSNVVNVTGIGEIEEPITVGEKFVNKEENGGMKSLNSNDVKIVDFDGSNSVMRGEPGFSITGFVETIFTMVSTGIGSIVSNIVGTESLKIGKKNRVNRVSYKGHQMVRITPNSDRQVADLKRIIEANDDEIKFWTMPMKNRSTDIIVAPDMLVEIKDFLRSQQFSYKVMMNDLQKTIANENPKMSKEQREDLVTSKGHSMTWKRYHRYADITRYLEYLAFTYPSLVQLETIGHSYEGQPIKLAKVSTGRLTKDGERKPVVWIDAGMHAREWIGPAVATYILNELVGKNTTYAKLLDRSDWMILPVSNPDGYEFSHTSDRLWRKTRSNRASLDAADNEARSGPLGLFHLVSHYTRWFFYRCEGVDPNRNFGYHWGEEDNGAASSDPCHETYAGPKAFSEPETRAIANYILANKQSIRMYLTLHSYSQMWLVPWGYTKTPPPDFEELKNVAKKAANAMVKVHGTRYQVGASPELLYPTSGGSDDWAKGVAGIKYSYTLELRDRGIHGFLLPATEIVPTARETWAGIRAMTRHITSST